MNHIPQYFSMSVKPSGYNVTGYTHHQPVTPTGYIVITTQRHYMRVLDFSVRFFCLTPAVCRVTGNSSVGQRENNSDMKCLGTKDQISSHKQK